MSLFGDIWDAVSNIPVVGYIANAPLAIGKATIDAGMNIAGDLFGGKDAPQAANPTAPPPVPDLTDDLVRRAVVRLEAKNRKITVAPALLHQKYAEQIQAIQKAIPSGADIDTALRTKALSRARLRVLIETELLLEQIALADFKPNRFLKVSTILIIPKSKSTSDLGDAIKLGDAAYAKLAKGDEWAKVLAETVSDPNLRLRDGLIGWREASNLPAEARESLLKGPVGTYTKPVQTSYGVQIFRLDAPLGTASGPDLAELKKNYSEAMRGPLMAKLMAKAKVVYGAGI
jgi:parvulin-like peptidyl-prolyl isomerase